MANIITLPNGRTLAYAEYGDPKGKPVFFFHGTPGSHFFRPPDSITARRGVRLICVDRPGYGLSTFQPGRSLFDWPVDVAQLADARGIDRFAVAGHSGGGPHTLACAYALPDRLSAAVTLSGAGPADIPGATAGMTELNRLGCKLGQYVPWLLWRILIWLVYRQRCADPGKAMDRDTGHRPPADDALISQPAIREACLQSEREAFRGGLKGLAWDARLLVRPWGFRLEEIKTPVFLWHGTDDDLTTIPMARYMAEKIPNCQIKICEGEAHLLLFPHWEEILTQLIVE